MSSLPFSPRPPALIFILHARRSTSVGVFFALMPFTPPFNNFPLPPVRRRWCVFRLFSLFHPPYFFFFESLATPRPLQPLYPSIWLISRPCNHQHTSPLDFFAPRLPFSLLFEVLLFKGCRETMFVDCHLFSRSLSSHRGTLRKRLFPFPPPWRVRSVPGSPLSP